MKLRALIIIFFSVSLIYSQSKRETRAVWVTTNFQLDWPPKTLDEQIQKNALHNIFENIDRKNLNTIYFQARSNGTVFFNSEYEPFSPYLTGKTGGTPNYDPLKYAVELAHKKGLELHAWVNVVRCYAGNNEEILSNPNHIVNKHPEWMVKIKEGSKLTYWLDMGLPEVRNYLVDLILDLAYNYNIDGVQLDFIRYPHQPFNDEFSFNLYGKGETVSEYRRNNITQFLKILKLNLRDIKPTLKIGVTPLGINKSIDGAYGLEGFNDVYQDAQNWLKLGLIDYAVPQIYWDQEENPKFEPLVKNWVSNGFGKNVIIGIAAYKEEVYSELDKQIEISRKLGANGVAFFRYNFIKDTDFPQFQQKVFPSLYPWLKKNPPLPPENLSYTLADDDGVKIKLSWQATFDIHANSETAYYALYQLDNQNDEPSLAKLKEVFNSDKSSVVIGIENPQQMNYYFAIKSLDKLWNESVESSNVVHVVLPKMKKLFINSAPFEKPVLISEPSGAHRILIYSSRESLIKVIAEGKTNSTIVLQNKLKIGNNIFTLTQDLQEYKKLKIIYGKEERIVELDLEN